MHLTFKKAMIIETPKYGPRDRAMLNLEFFRFFFAFKTTAHTFMMSSFLTCLKRGNFDKLCHEAYGKAITLITKSFDMNFYSRIFHKSQTFRVKREVESIVYHNMHKKILKFEHL